MSGSRTVVPIHAIIPAAGLGRRMGRPKQTLPYRASTIVGSVVRTLLDVDLETVIVVTRRDLLSRLDLPEDSRVSIAINDDGGSQMIDSLRIGLSVLFGPARFGATDTNHCEEDESADAGILILPGDMPGVTAEACRCCVSAFRLCSTRIVVAARGGVRGHPVILPSGLRARVEQHEGGLNALLRTMPERLTLIETGDEATLHDVDTWNDYTAMLPGRRQHKNAKPWPTEHDR